MRFAAVLLLFAAAAQAQPADFPVFDSDNFAHGFGGPSMEQSVDASAAFYEGAGGALQRAWGKHEKLGKLTVALFEVFDVAVLPLPLGDAWLHEEFHRSVMTNRGIASFNDVYRFQTGQSAIAVSHVRDDDLVRLKLDHPADLVRLGEAGIEGEALLVARLEKDRFFRGSKTWHLPLYWFIKANSAGYVASGSSAGDVNDETEQWEREEGTSVKRRDFTGHDFTGWVYDLFRPDEPYQARGVHPSGVGIRRYRRTTDLTPQEHDYLERVGRRMVLNFLDPNLIGIDGFTVRGAAFNLNATYLLTSFGTTTDVNAFLRRGGAKLYVVVHRYENGERSFPGVDAELLDRPMILLGRRVEVTPRIALWLQPEGQRFRDRDGKPGGLAAVRVRYGRTFVDLEAKSAGWVAGNVHLDSNVTARFGVVVPLPQ